MLISKEAETLLAILYREYLTRRKHAVPMSRARIFPSSETIQESFMPKWSLEDVSDLCWALCREDLLACCPGDDLALDVFITDAGLAYMEQRFSRNVSSVLAFLASMSGIVSTWL